jgi:hypothetical protein
VRKSTKSAVLALSAMTAIGGSVVMSSPAMAVSSPIAVCGGGKYHVVDKHAFKKKDKHGHLHTLATTYLLYNGSSNCVITWKAQPDTKYVGAGILKVGNTKWTWQSGHFRTYAGPVRLKAKGACIAWAGAYDSTVYWTKHWGHCGK